MLELNYLGQAAFNGGYRQQKRPLMKFALISLLSFILLAYGCSQSSKNYPGKLEIRGYHIGDQVDTAKFKRTGTPYIPSHLDEWTRENAQKLHEKYNGLPVALWVSKNDRLFAMTLLDNIVLNIMVSGFDQPEKDSLSKVFTKKFGIKGTAKSYEITHPNQDLITYWNLETWDTGDVILEFGNNEMRLPTNPPYEKPIWDMIYSDFKLEKAIIDDFKNKVL